MLHPPPTTSSSADGHSVSAYSSVKALGSVANFLDAVDGGLDLGVDALLDESYRPNEGRVRSRMLTRQRVAERIAHNLWGESAGHRAALRADSEWSAALAAFDELDALLTPPAN